MTKLRTQAELTKPNTHKMNYGRVPPPILSLDNELRSTTYQLWRANWWDFFEKAKMHDSEGLTFLKEQSILDKTLKNWPAPPDDPQGIRVASVIEFSVCLSVCVFVCLLWANFLISYHIIISYDIDVI